MRRTLDTTPERPLRALVLDDDGAALHELRGALEGKGFEVLAACDGTSGLALLTDELLALDVLLVDLDLPGRDARAFAELIRRAGGERDLAIVVLAGAADAEARAELVALGIDAVVERSDGAAAAAGAAITAVAARASSTFDAETDAAAALGPQPPSPALGLSFGGWSLLAA